MKNIFQKSAKDGQIEPSIMQRINEGVEKAKHSIADYLNGKLAKLSPKAQRRLMLTLGVLVVAVCVGILVEAINGEPILLNDLQHTQVVQPSLPTRQAIEIERTRQLREFETMMDSIYRSPYGREIFMEIKRERPGLIDTINMIIHMRH